MISLRFGNMKILKYENRKCDPAYWDISTPEKKEAAFWRLFKLLEEEWSVYQFDDVEKNISNSKSIVAMLTKDLEGTVSENAAIVIRKELNANIRVLKDWQTYEDQILFYKGAKSGNFKSLMNLLKCREDYEYERWSIETVIDPLKKK